MLGLFSVFFQNSFPFRLFFLLLQRIAGNDSADITNRRLLDALFLTCGNLAVQKLVIGNKATVDAHLDMQYHSFKLFIFISAWASALLVQMIRAMLEPPQVGRVTQYDSHAFCFRSVLGVGGYRKTKENQYN